MAKRAAARGTDPDREIVDAWTGSWFLFVITGILWLLLGFLCLSYRPSSVSIVVVFIAIVFWMGALASFALAVVTRGGWRIFAIVTAVLALGAGVGALVWPAPTVLI